MNHPQLHQQLEALEVLILKEREYAIRLKVEELKALQDEKGRLLDGFRDLVTSCPAELKEWAARLSRENRRNARLLATTLTFLRQTMESCCRDIAPVLYGSTGDRIQGRTIGVLLTGRV